MIGLISGIGSGKSYVASRLTERGVTTVDTGAIAYEVAAPGDTAIPKLVEAFGANILHSDGAMGCDAMRAPTFSNTMTKSRLEQTAHPLIRGIMLSHGAATQAPGAYPYLVYVVPLLVESLAGHHSQRSLVGHILVVDCPADTQTVRMIAGNGLPRVQMKAIIARQTSCGARLTATDDVIDSNGTLADLLPQVDHLGPTYRSS